jgi:hypothetical protein
MSRSLAETYDLDFYAWAMRNAELIREGRLSEIDVENVAEELESMGKSQRRALSNRLIVLLAHFLKWQYQPDKRSRSWKNTIKVQRLDLRELLDENPSLQPSLQEAMVSAYTKARLLAASDTGLDEMEFPEDCPFTLEQAMDSAYWPQE